MTTTVKLGLDKLAAAQSQPEVLINRTSDRIDVLVQPVAIDFADAPPSPAVDGDTYIIGTGSGPWAGLDGHVAYYADGWLTVEPALGWLFYVQADGTHYRFEDSVSPHTWVELATGGGGGGITGLDIGFYFPGGPPSPNQLLLKYVATRALTFAANFAEAQGHIGTNPTSSFVMTVSVAGVSVGTITVSTGGAFTFATSGGAAVDVVAGDQIEIAGPASADATAADIAATLVAAV